MSYINSSNYNLFSFSCCRFDNRCYLPWNTFLQFTARCRHSEQIVVDVGKVVSKESKVAV